MVEESTQTNVKEDVRELRKRMKNERDSGSDRD